MRGRKNTRLTGYDYSSDGAYFVTLCVKNRECLFGEIEGTGIKPDRMKLNQYGRIAFDCWQKLPQHCSNCRLDEFIIMPNHVHGVIFVMEFANADNRPVGNRHACSLRIGRNHQQLPVIVGAYKSAVSKRIRRAGGFEFQWQKSYYDRIIRHDEELNRIREYVAGNPQGWERDRENPAYGRGGSGQ